MKGQVLFDTWKLLLQDIRTIQGTVTKAYKILWNASDDLLEEFKMKIVPAIDEATPFKVRIVEADERREANQRSIE